MTVSTYMRRLLALPISSSNVLSTLDTNHRDVGNLVPEVIGVDLVDFKVQASATVANCSDLTRQIDDEIARLTQARHDTEKVRRGALRMLETISQSGPVRPTLTEESQPADNRPKVPTMKHADINTRPIG
jgi:hypothetical protein